MFFNLRHFLQHELSRREGITCAGASVLVDLIDTATGEEHISEYIYDTHKRIVNTYESNPISFFRKDLEYNTHGQLSRQYYYSESGGNVADKWIKYTYLNGYKKEIIEDSSQQVLWNVDEVNARGQLVTAFYANNLGKVTNTYDAVGMPYTISYRNVAGPNISVTPFATFTTNFNPQRKLLNNRTSTLFSIGNPLTESFTYDTSDRLETISVNNSNTSQAYDAAGRITNNIIGNYTYKTTSPYQLESIALVGSDNENYYNDRPLQEILYTPFHSPLTINEDGNERITFAYNGLDSRSAMYYGGISTTMNARPLRKFYSNDGLMEIKMNTVTNTFDHIFYIGGDAYTAPAIFRKNAAGSSFNYLHRDYLGSILAITNPVGQLLEKRHFDAWGETVKLQNGTGTNISNFSIIDRGYTGHEHLLGVGLINMNGRLYDPILHRFLSPDNNVQEPYNTQNFNRYGYVLNNPLMYTDPSGESHTVLAAIVDTFRNFFKHGFDFESYDWHRTEMAWRIDAGLFKGNFGQIVSRFTWESLQWQIGYAAAGATNQFGNVLSVSYYGGATAVETNRDMGGVSLGSYIIGGEGLSASPDEILFQHEYGHYLQSQKFGFFYISKIGLPSLLSAWEDQDNHNFHPVEQDANIRAFKYFNNQIDNYNDWNDANNPIIGYNFADPAGMNSRQNYLALRGGLLKLQWFDYAITPITSIYWMGLFNYYYIFQ